MIELTKIFMKLTKIIFAAISLFGTLTFAQIPVGSGSFTLSYPGANGPFNNFPSGSPQLSKNAIGKPVNLPLPEEDLQ